MRTLFFVLLGLVFLVLAQSMMLGVPSVQASPVNKKCPVTAEAVDGTTTAVVAGDTVGFCCPGCVQPFAAWAGDRQAAFLTQAKSGVIASVAPAKAKFKSEAYSLTYCVVSGEKLGSMGEPIIKKVDGREVRLCCKGCVKGFNKDKAKMMAKIDAALMDSQRRFFPTKKCMISGEPLFEKGKDIATEFVVGNRLVRVCCKSCVRKFKKKLTKNMAKLNKMAADAQRKDYPLDTCLVAKSKLGSMGKPTETVVAGRLFRFCCGGCNGKLEKNPAKFIVELDKAWAAKGKYKKAASRPTSKPGHGGGHEGHDH